MEAKAELVRLLGAGASEVERVYDELYGSRETRPTAAEILHLGYLPSTLRGTHGSWFEFLMAKGHLSEAEGSAFDSGKAWFEELEITPMTKSFKMVTLKALLEAESLFEGLGLGVLAQRSYAILLRSPELMHDLADVKEMGDSGKPEPAAWQAYWRKNPVAAWTGKGRWFRVEGERFVSRLPRPMREDVREAFEAMTEELVEYRLAQYRRRRQEDRRGESFECNLIHAGDKAILKLPDRKKRPDVPAGETPVELPDGRVWIFRFVKEYCNVAHPAGSPRNQLADLMRGWFGLAAGKPGTHFRVRFSRGPEGLRIEPVGIEDVRLPAQRKIPFFASLVAAAGFDGSASSAIEAELREVAIEGSLDGLFAVRASGSSMDGGPDPIRDGDWLVFRLARGEALSRWTDRICLVDTARDLGPEGRYLVKRVRVDGGTLALASDNPVVERREVGEEAEVVAVLVRRLSRD